MKILKVLFIPVTALAFTACTKETDDDTVKIPRSKIDARVNGSTYYSTETQAMQSGNVVTFLGTRNPGVGKQSAIALQLKNYTGPGTYRLDSTTQASYTDVGVVYGADSGVVVITAINAEKYTGSFGFRANGPNGAIRVSEGIIEVFK